MYNNERDVCSSLLHTIGKLSHLLFWGGVLLLAVAIFFVNHCTPMMQDDYLYSTYHFTPGRLNQGLRDIWESCYHHYFDTNGRMANNVITMLLFVGGKGLYNMLATVVSLTGLVLMARLFCGRVTLFSILLVTGACLLVLPGLYHTCCWCSGAVNYIWGAVLLLLVLFVVQVVNNKMLGGVCWCWRLAGTRCLLPF